MCVCVCVWVIFIFLGCFLKYVSSFYYHLGIYLKPTRNQYLLKKKKSLFTVSIHWLESCSSLGFTAINAIQKWTVFTIDIKKENTQSLNFVNVSKFFLFYFYCKCYIHVVKRRNQFNLTCATNKHLRIQLQFFKARLNVQIITCADDYLWGFLCLPRKVDRECSASLWLYSIGQSISAGESGEIYGWYRLHLLQEWSNPVPSLLHGHCNDAQKFRWKISYVHESYR